MRFLSRLLILSLFVWIPSGFVAMAQTTTSIHDENEDLRETVRLLALRVSALEEELHKQRAGAAVETASLKPATLVLPRADVRSSVESVSSSVRAVAWWRRRRWLWRVRRLRLRQCAGCYGAECGGEFNIADVFAWRSDVELHV